MKNFQFDAGKDLMSKIIADQLDNLRAGAKAHCEAADILMQNNHVCSADNIDADENWYKTKNYNWILVQDQDFDCIIRWYSWHLSLIFRFTDKQYYFGSPLAMVTIEIDENIVPDNDHDALLDNPFHVLGPISKLVIDKAIVGDVHICWTISEQNIPSIHRLDGLTYHPYKKYVRVAVPINHKNLRDPKMMGFMLEEIASLHMNLMCEFTFKDYLIKHADKKFVIPRDNKGFFTGIAIQDNEVFVTYVEDSKEKLEYIDRVFMYHLDKFYPVLDWF